MAGIGVRRRLEDVLKFSRAWKLPSSLKNGKQNDEYLKAKPFNEIPGDLKLPFIGTGWTLLPIVGLYDTSQVRQANIRRLHKYGKIVREEIGPNLKIVHLYDVRDFEQVFQHEGQYPDRPGFAALRYLRKKKPHIFSRRNLVTASGKSWYEVRTKTQTHLLRPLSVTQYLPAMHKISCEMVDKITNFKKEEEVMPDFVAELFKWALESLAFVAFHKRLGCLDLILPEESEAMQVINSVIGILEANAPLEFSVFRLWKYLPTPRFVKSYKNMKWFSRFSLKYINVTLEKLKSESSADERNSLTLLEHLIVTEKMEVDAVSGVVTDLFLGGIDTTAHSVAFAMYNLSRHPEAQEKIRQELRRVLRNPSDPIISDVLNDCRYLRACLKESLRVSSTVDIIPRKLREDIVLHGYQVPAGTAIFIEAGMVFQMEENYPNASKFLPERWLRNESGSKLNPFAFLPFGFGRRSCIGRRLFEQESLVFLIRLLQKYNIECDNDIGYISRTVNSPDKPLKFKFVPV